MSNKKKKHKDSELIQCCNYRWRLFQRANGVYYADGRGFGAGKQSLSTRDKNEALSALSKLDAFVASQQSNAVESVEAPDAGIPDQPISIAAGWEMYIAERDQPVHLGGLKPSSIRKYRGHKKRFAAYCQGKGCDNWIKVDKKLLTDYATSQDGKLSPVTIHDDLVMEISVASWLTKQGLLPPTRKINWKLKKPPGAEKYCYEKDEVARMLELSKPLDRSRWLYPTIMLLSRTGIRIGEARNLKWSDVDLKNEVIHIRDESFKKVAADKRRHVKNGESRIIPLVKDLLSYLSAVTKKSGYVLRGDRGRQLNYNHILDAFVKQVIEPLSSEFTSPKNELGFKDGRFHSFRHFFVSECFAAGVPESDIQLWVGHADSKVVALYRHIRDEIAKENIRKIDFGAA